MRYHDALPHHRVIRLRAEINKKDAERSAIDIRKKRRAEMFELVKRQAIESIQQLIEIKSEELAGIDAEFLTCGVVVLSLRDWSEIAVLLETASHSGAVRARSYTTDLAKINAQNKQGGKQ